MTRSILAFLGFDIATARHKGPYRRTSFFFA